MSTSFTTRLRGPSYFATWLCILIAAITLESNRLAIRQVNAQLISSVDADGNTIVETVVIGEDGLETISTISTIPVDPATAIPAAPAPITSDPNAPPAVTLGQAPAPEPTGQSRPPVTYIRYTTIDGAQVTITDTFTATTPIPSTTIAPGKGSILDIATYLPPPPSTTPSGSASHPFTQFSESNAQVAAIGLLLSIILGAIVVL